MDESAIYFATREGARASEEDKPLDLAEVERNLEEAEKTLMRTEAPAKTALVDTGVAILAEEAIRRNGVGNRTTAQVGKKTGMNALASVGDRVLKDADPSLRMAKKPMTKLLTGALRFAPGIGTGISVALGAPEVRDQAFDHIDHFNKKGAVEGQHPSYFTDQALIEMANQGDEEARSILMHRSDVDGKPRLAEPTIYDQVDQSIQSSAGSMGSMNISNALVVPEFSSEEEFNKWDTDGSGMLSQDEVMNYRSEVNIKEVDLNF